MPTSNHTILPLFFKEVEKWPLPCILSREIFVGDPTVWKFKREFTDQMAPPLH